MSAVGPDRPTADKKVERAATSASLPSSSGGPQDMRREKSDPSLGSAVPAAKTSDTNSSPDTDSFIGRRASSFKIERNAQSRMLQSQHTIDNLISISGIKNQGDAESFKREVAAVRQQLANLNKFTFNPRSRFMRSWDLVTVCALLFTAFVTPFEVAFFPPQIYAGPYNFASNRLVDLIFFADIIITFFLPYRAPQRDGGIMVFDNRKIARNYLRGFFFLDLITILPFDLLFVAANSGGGDEDSQLFRLLRMLRLLKLMRVIRASRIISRWQDHVSVSHALISLVRFTFLIAILAHWLACLWGFISIEGDSAWRDYGSGHSWRQKHSVPVDATSYGLYGISLYVALNNIFGGSCEINPANYGEFFAQCFMLVLGSSVWAYVIGSACGIVATLDPARIEYHQTMDELNYFCRDQALPNDLGVRLRGFFRNTIHMSRSKRYEALLKKMSMRLRGDAAYRMCEYRLKSVPFLVHPDLEPEFMCHLAIRYHTAVYSELERVPCSDLFIVERGVVAKRGHLGLVGMCFGKDVILSNDNLRDLGDAIALTFVQAISLTQKDIFDVLPDYPQAFFIVRKAALRMAMTRALVKAAGIVKRSKISKASLSLTEMFDTAMREAADTRSGELQETAAKKEPLMLTLKVFREAGKAKDLPALMAMRQKEADGGLKGGWGKLGSNLLQGSKEAAAKGHAKVRLSNLLEKEKQVKPLSVEESVVALSAKWATSHNELLAKQQQAAQLRGENHAQMVARLTALEGAVRTIVDALGSPSRPDASFGRRRSTSREGRLLREGRPRKNVLENSTADGTRLLNDTSASEERRELRVTLAETEAEVSSPFEA